MQFDIRRLDIYRKIPKDLTQPTFAGAFISICSCLFMAFLFISELLDFIHTDVISELFVDDPVGQHSRIPVRIDLTILGIKCPFVGLDIQDDLGRHEVGMVENVDRKPINLDNKEGCRFKATFKINKVPGNFHISTHSAQAQPENPDMRHIIHEVTFGDQVVGTHLPGSFNPLKEKDQRETKALSSHDYFIKVVPTVHEDSSGSITHPYQYTFAHRDYLQYGHGHKVLPAIWFRYDLSPITVKYTDKRKPLYSFLTMVCAIVGGTFTVAGIIDSTFFTAVELFRKAELGKLS